MKMYSEKIRKLRQEIIADIKEILTANNGVVKIPFFYDEDEIDNDIETLIEDEYDVQVGDKNNNLRLFCQNYCGVHYSVEVVAVHFDKRGDIICVTKSSDIVYIEDVTDLYALADLHDALSK